VAARCLAFAADTDLLIAGGSDGIVVRDLATRRAVTELPTPGGMINAVAVVPDDGRFATASSTGRVDLWDPAVSGAADPVGVHPGRVNDVAFGRTSATLLSAGADGTISVWQLGGGAVPPRTFAGHATAVSTLAFVGDERTLLSRSIDGTLVVWDAVTGDQLTVLGRDLLGGAGGQLAVHPSLFRVATVDSETNDILVIDLDIDGLALPRRPSVSYTSAKVVLVGDPGVGKTGLGWRLAYGDFREHASSHGQQFWQLAQLSHTRTDGAECEVVLWDLAGQPDYRLIHTLFLDDADVALLVFDPARFEDPLRGVEYWLRQFGSADAAAGRRVRRPYFILVAARLDVCSPWLSMVEIDAFCHRWGIDRYVETSARRGDGVDELAAGIANGIAWDEMPTTVSTEMFRAIRDHVLELKETRGTGDLIVLPVDLAVEGRTGADDNRDILSAAGHLANHGYITPLISSAGERHFLLAPELLNNLAASLILEARRDPKDLGSLDEHALRQGEYAFPELAGLSEADRYVLLDSTIAMFLDHNVCFRETDPFSRRAFLVFPGLINLRRPPLADAARLEETIWYTATGAVANAYSSLVVLMGYTTTFTRTDHWRDHARYVLGDGLVCGFGVASPSDGVLEFGLDFGPGVPGAYRTLFQGLFESFLARPGLVVTRQEVPCCAAGHRLSRETVRMQLAEGQDHAFCPRCGDRVSLATQRNAGPIEIQPGLEVRAEQTTATQRSRFEQPVFRLRSYVADAGIATPTCFVSYAWGAAGQERWVERFATDLANAGIAVVLDRWANSRHGKPVPRFVERVAECDNVIVVGTPEYRRKYLNNEPMRSFVVAAEGDLIGYRMIGSEAAKQSVMPILLAGSAEESLPPLLRGRVYGDFRAASAYFTAALDLLLSLYAVDPRSPARGAIVDALRDSG
jgi:small GTP-binding protein